MASEARLNLVITAQDQARSVIEDFASSIKETFSGLQEELSRAFNMSEVVSTIGEAMDTIKRDISEVSMGNALEEQFNTLNKSVEETAKVVGESFNQMVESASKAGEEMSRAFNMSTVETTVADGMAAIEREVSGVNISTSLEEQFRGMVAAVEESTNEIRNIVATLDSGFNNLISSSEKTTEAVSQGFETMSRNITESTDQMVQALENAGNSSKHLDESLDFMNLQMAGEMIKQVGDQITGFFENAVHSAADFDQNIVNTTASLDANMGTMKLSTQQIKAMQDAAISMGESGFFSANQVADAMNTMSKQGITYQQIMSGGIQTVYKVAAANQADMESTANVVSDIYNEMGDMFKASGMSAQQASQLIGNSMTVALHHARISMEDFMTTMKYVGPQAAAMGVGIKDVSATIALLGQHGIRASQAGTTIRRMLTNLTPASKAAAAEMKDLGMITKDGSNIFYDAAGKMKPLAEVQQLLHDKLAALNPEQQQFAIKTIFGQYALSGMTAIVNTAPSKYKALTDAMNNNNVMTDIMNEKSKGLGMEIQRLNAHWQTVQKTIGEALKPVVESLINGLNGLMKAWEGLSPHTQKMIIDVTALTGVIAVLGGGLLATVGTIGMFSTAFMSGMETITKMGSGILNAGSAFLKFGNMAVQGIRAATLALVSNPMILVITAIVAAVAIAAYEIYKHWDTVRSSLTTAWNAISHAATAIFNGLSNFFKQWGITLLAIFVPVIGLPILIAQHWSQIKTFASQIFTETINVIRNIWNSAVSWISGAAQAFANAIVKAFQWMYNHNYYFKDLVDFIKSAWNAAVKDAQTIWSSITSFLQKTWSNLVNIGQTAFRGFENLLSTIWRSISNAARSVFSALQSSLSSIWNATVSAGKSVFSTLASFFSSLWSAISSGTSSAWNGIRNTIANLVTSAINAIKGPFNSLGSFFSGLWGQAEQWGANLVNMMANGIKNAAGAVGNAVKSVASSIANVLGFHSPSKEGPGSDADKWMPNLMNMFVQGIQQHTPQFQMAINNVALGLKTGVTSVNHNISTNQISIPANRTNPTQPNINIYIDGRSTKTDNDLAEIIAHKIYRQMPVVS